MNIISRKERLKQLLKNNEIKFKFTSMSVEKIKIKTINPLARVNKNGIVHNTVFVYLSTYHIMNAFIITSYGSTKHYYYIQ